MTKAKTFFFFLFNTFLLSCETVSDKIDEKTALEEKELSRWLKKSETELKAVYGQPNKVQFLDLNNRFYIYTSKKFHIKCERNLKLIKKYNSWFFK